MNVWQYIGIHLKIDIGISYAAYVSILSDVHD